MASSPSSNRNVHSAHRSRSRSRGIRFKDFVLDKLDWLSEETGEKVNVLVNRACETFLAEKLTGEVLEEFTVEAELENLIEEEKSLREKLTVILRSGAYLRDYARRLFEGDTAEFDRLRKRIGAYSHMTEEEIDVALRILARREAISKRLVELMDKILPKERYSFGLTEKGWKINPRGGEKA